MESQVILLTISTLLIIFFMHKMLKEKTLVTLKPVTKVKAPYISFSEEYEQKSQPLLSDIPTIDEYVSFEESGVPSSSVPSADKKLKEKFEKMQSTLPCVKTNGPSAPLPCNYVEGYGSASCLNDFYETSIQEDGVFPNIVDGRAQTSLKPEQSDFPSKPLVLNYNVTDGKIKPNDPPGIVEDKPEYTHVDKEDKFPAQTIEPPRKSEKTPEPIDYLSEFYNSFTDQNNFTSYPAGMDMDIKI